MTHPDLERLRREYAAREARLAGSNAYSFFNPAHLFTIQQRQRAMLTALRQFGITTLSGLDILEMGCGAGGVLLELAALGADPAHLTGVDLLPARLNEAQIRLPSSRFIEADGQQLPFDMAHFELVLQFTAFSSILDINIRQQAAREMLRVLRPGGIVLWYDFWWNPTNRQTRGITPHEVRALFPGCNFHFRCITLAPPIAGRLVPVSWNLAMLLESLRLFNSHYLAIIQPGD